MVPASDGIWFSNTMSLPFSLCHYLSISLSLSPAPRPPTPTLTPTHPHPWPCFACLSRRNFFFLNYHIHFTYNTNILIIISNKTGKAGVNKHYIEFALSCSFFIRSWPWAVCSMLGFNYRQFHSASLPSHSLVGREKKVRFEAPPSFYSSDLPSHPDMVCPFMLGGEKKRKKKQKRTSCCVDVFPQKTPTFCLFCFCHRLTVE